MKMSNEKIPALYASDDTYEERKPKSAYCRRSVIIWVLALLLIALGVTLCVEFLYPVVMRSHRFTNVEVLHVYDKKPIEVREKTQTNPDKTVSDTIADEPWHLDFLINPTGLCDTLEPPESEAYGKNPEVKLLVLVQSPTPHFAEREAIRKTWGAIADKPHGPTRLGFILGTTFNATEEGMISKESEVHGDIIQADFQDTQRNLTTKSVLMLKWVSKYCPHAQYVLKANDDTFVNFSVVTQLLQRDPFAPDEKFIAGFIHRGHHSPTKPDMNDDDMDLEYFEGEDDYPLHASGESYVTTGPTASKLFEASKLVKPFLPIDDVFITGLCADKIAAKLIHEPSFRYEELTNPLKLDGLSSLATIHGVSPTDMDHLWNMMTKVISDALDFDSDKIFSAPLMSFGNKPFPNFFDQWIKQSEKLMDDDDDWVESHFDGWDLPETEIDKLNKPPKVKTNIEIVGWIGDQANPGLRSQIQVGSGKWPFNQMKTVPTQRQESQAPLTWQKSFIIPIPLNRGGRNEFNITHLMRF